MALVVDVLQQTASLKTDAASSIERESAVMAILRRLMSTVGSNNDVQHSTMIHCGDAPAMRERDVPQREPSLAAGSVGEL